MVPDPPSHHVDIIKSMCGQFGPQMQPLPFYQALHTCFFIASLQGNVGKFIQNKEFNH